MVEAFTDRIERALGKHSAVRQPVDTGWVLLLALASEGSTLRRRDPGGGWSSVAPEENAPS